MVGDLDLHMVFSGRWVFLNSLVTVWGKKVKIEARVGTASFVIM